MGFASEQQRRAVMALMHGGPGGFKRPRIPKNASVVDLFSKRMEKRGYDKKRLGKLFDPSVNRKKLKDAGFYPQYKRGTPVNRQFWAMWIKGTNRYLHHLAFLKQNPGSRIRKGEQIHHVSKNRLDNRKRNLQKLTAGTHSGVSNIIRTWEKEGTKQLLPDKGKMALAMRQLKKQRKLAQSKKMKKVTAKRKTLLGRVGLLKE